MFEHRHEPLLPLGAFIVRVARSFLFASVILSFFLGVGILGYYYVAGFSLVDSILNASMILSGMGPVGDFKNDAGKLFAAFYALLSGLVFITVAGIVFTPVAHRVLHWFHIEEDEKRAAEEANSNERS